MFNILSFKTALGWITVQEGNKKLISVKFGKQVSQGKSKILIKAKKQIIDFSCRKLKKFNLDIFLEGSVLQKKIWKELQKIQYGKTKTYGEIAENLNTSPRYVGNVCGQNNHLLVIPCHRVVRSDGSLGGFSGLGGIKLKNKLIKMEKNV
jgi:methylated-DNA-[protein]-cysteine S-methyltransferase